MFTKALTTLKGRLSPHLALSNSRLEAICLLIVRMVNAQTANLSYLAREFPSGTKVESTYRRLQRFFQHVNLGPDWAAPLLVKMVGPCTSWYLYLIEQIGKLATPWVLSQILADGGFMDLAKHSYPARAKNCDRTELYRDKTKK
jgi:hypothetical protein